MLIILPIAMLGLTASTQLGEEIRGDTERGPGEDQLRNASYVLPDLGPFQLRDGLYEVRYDEGATQFVRVTYLAGAVGDLDGDAVEDAAAALALNSGGSGTFFYLVAIRDVRGSSDQMPALLLGDRVQVSSVAIGNGRVAVAMKDFARGDPLCCPSLDVVRSYGLAEGGLSLLSDESPRPAVQPPSGDIVGIVWKWEQFRDTSGERDLTVDRPDAYTLLLRPDGRFESQVDCNRLSGSYDLEGSRLTLQLGPTTLAACPPESLYDTFMQRIGTVASWVLSGDRLVLNLKFDSGDMIFRR